jgi:hypothetical protein
MPNLAFTIEEAGADLLFAWHQDFVINGNNQATAEKNGTLQFLAPNGSDVFTLTFHNLGIFKLARERTANAQAPRRLRAEMYCDGIDFQYNGAAAVVSQVVSPDGSDDSKNKSKKDAKPQFRGAYTQGLAVAARQAELPSPDPVTNAFNLVRPSLKFRT